MAGRTYERAIDLMEAELGDELVALSVENGSCFGFNAVATTVWQELAEPRTFDELKSRLLAQYEVEPDQCTRELGELLDEMVRSGIVRSSASPNPG